MSKWKQQREKEEEENKIPTLEEFEEGMKNEITDLQQAFRDRAANEQQRFADVCDTDYYFVVFFSNYDQMVEFCDTYHLDIDDLYIDGRKLARNIGKAIKTPDSAFPKIQPFNKDYVERSMTEEDIKQQHKKN